MKEQSVLFNFIQFVRFVNAGTSLRVASGLEADASGPEAAVPGLTIPILLITKDSECIQHPVLIPLPVAVLVPAFIRIVGYPDRHHAERKGSAGQSGDRKHL